MKEIKLSPNIGQHDVEYRVKQANKFLEGGHQVKVTLTFKGRENIHEDIGWNTMNDFVSLCNCTIAGGMKLNQGKRKTITCTLNPLGKKNGKK